eukprot:354903-Chlamydomonas_euryale.AAC.11
MSPCPHCAIPNTHWATSNFFSQYTRGETHLRAAVLLREYKTLRIVGTPLTVAAQQTTSAHSGMTANAHVALSGACGPFVFRSPFPSSFLCLQSLWWVVSGMTPPDPIGWWTLGK